MKNITRNADLADRDLKHLLHPQTNIADLLAEGPKIMDCGKGIRVTDATGKEVIDGLAGLWCVNVGYGRRELAEVMKLAAENLSYFHSLNSLLPVSITSVLTGRLEKAALAAAPISAIPSKLWLPELTFDQVFTMVIMRSF